MSIPTELDEFLDYVAHWRAELDLLDPVALPDGCLPLPLDQVGMPPPGPDFQEVADLVLDELPPAPPKPRRGDPEYAAKLAARQQAIDEWIRRRERLLAILMRDALYRSPFALATRVRDKGTRLPAEYVAGTTGLVTEEDREIGPVGQRDVMVVGMGPSLAELHGDARPFQDRAAGALYDALNAAGVCDLQHDPELGLVYGDPGQTALWYFTYLVKHAQLNPATKTSPARHVKNGLWLLHAELRLTRPKFLLLLGSTVAKAVLGPSASVSSLVGKVIDWKIPIHRPGEPEAYHPCKVMVTLNPAAVLVSPANYADFADGVGMFCDLVRGRKFAAVETGVRHVNLYTPDQLAAALAEMKRSAWTRDDGRRVIELAMDAEWHGNHPSDPYGYLRSIQFSFAERTGFCICLRGQGGTRLFHGGQDRAIAMLRAALLEDPALEVRVGGHYFRADLAWLIPAGLDLRPLYQVAPTPEQTRDYGGWDTFTLAKAVREEIPREIGGYGLDVLASLYCRVPRYAGLLEAWKTRYCKQRGLKADDLLGYGEAPDEVIHPDNSTLTPSYACYDVDAPLRLFRRQNGDRDRPGLLDADPLRGVSGRKAFWYSHLAAPGFLEMERHGLEFDMVRAEQLLAVYEDVYAEKLAEFRAAVRWPTFNPDSANDSKEFLFGWELNRRAVAPDVDPRISPPDAVLLYLTPVTDTNGKPWDELVAAGVADLHNPNTRRETLGILSYSVEAQRVVEIRDGRAVTAKELLDQLRDLRFLRQVQKQLLPPPPRDHKTQEWLKDEHGDVIVEKGLPRVVHADGRVRTHFGQVETGRASSWGPNLQNISASREDDLRRILKDPDAPPDSRNYSPTGRYRHPLRSMLRASPGHVIVGCDYKQAEMAWLAWMSQDAAFCADIAAGLDLHAKRAVSAFGLDTPAHRERAEAAGVAWRFDGDYGKALLKALGGLSQRTAAKNVNFGVPYRRSAASIARQCHEQNNPDITVADCQAMIDSFKAGYPRADAFLTACEDASQDPGVVYNCFGRPRRFAPTRNPETRAAQRRSACNMPIQGGVADLVNQAIYHMLELRRERAGDGHTFTMVLQLHDALYFEVPIPALFWFKALVEEGMSRRIDIWPTTPTGERVPGVAEPYHLGIDFEVYYRWGEKLDPAWAEAQGVPEEFWAH